MKGLLLAASLAAFAFGAIASDPKDDVKNFKSWKRLTSTPVPLPDPYAYYCAPPVPRNLHNGGLIQAYANPIAEAKAIAAVELVKKDNEKKLDMTFPSGSILVKTKFGQMERGSNPGDPKYDPSKNYPIDFMTVMIKRAKGSSPKTGDWEFLVMDGAGKNLLGKQDAKPCYNCHQDAPADGAFLKYGQ